MRRFVAVAVAGVALVASFGCSHSCCTNDPLIRQDQLSERSEDVRQVGPMHPWQGEQEKPGEHLAPVRIHGGIQ